MYHFARVSGTVSILVVVAEDGSAKAQTFIVVINILNVSEVAFCPPDALAPQEIKADIRVKQLILVASIHGRWKVAILKEKAFFFTRSMDELAKFPFT
jgi:hypothetical protein